VLSRSADLARAGPGQRGRRRLVRLHGACEIVARLEAEIVRALADPEVKKKLLVQGLEPRPGSAAAFGKFIDDETRKWSELIREAGLKGE
jgi:hypothetical protein